MLEASAGTGKTYTLEALAARYVCEGIPLEEMLLISFTRLASGELRERVRARLVASEWALAQAAGGNPPPGLDPVTALLCQGPPAEIARRRELLARAVRGFDAATIATTHSFCQDVLAELGTLADYEPGFTFTETIDDLLEEVVDDLYVRAFYHPDDQDKLSRREIQEVADLVVRHPRAPLVPGSAVRGSATFRRVRAATQIRRELERRKRRLSLLSYDDLLTRLLSTVHAQGGEAARWLAQRYRVVLIDEFQDTDPVQWDIVRTAFVAPEVTLVLIGDPKQAIYAFRGADVYAYLKAVRAAGTEATLATNWRSDGDLVDGLGAFFAGAELGHPEIVHRPVQAAAAHRGSRLRRRVGGALRLRLVPQDLWVEYAGGKRLASVDLARRFVAGDVATVIAELLSSDTDREERDEGGAVRGTPRPIGPGDIAVLTRRHQTAEAVHGALRDAGLPSVVGGAGSVFLSAAAPAWLALLEALEQPASSSRARKVALGPFIGRRASWLASASEADLEQVHGRLHRWSRVLRVNGVAALLSTISREELLAERVLRTVGGERELTDLRHLAQLLHRAAVSDRLGLSALVSWLRHRMSTAEAHNSDEERSRRLESDEQAVQVMTIHRSKGLEFPIVLCPDLWDWTKPSGDRSPVAFHDHDNDDELTLEVGLDPQRGYDAHRRQADREAQGEWLRLTYVAMTRANHQTVAWWTGSYFSKHSGLSRLLFDRGQDGSVPDFGQGVPRDDFAEKKMRELAARAPGALTVELCRPGAAAHWLGGSPEPLELAAARFTRTVDRQWRRASYSSITAAAYEALVGSEPEDAGVSDEPEGSGASGEGSSDGLPEAATGPSPMGSLPAGTAFGTVVHRVLQRADFAAEDLESELLAAVEELGGRLLDAPERTATAAALHAVLHTPLGPLLNGRTLRGLARADRLDELVFELPLVGGEQPTGQLTLAAMAEVLSRWLPAEDPLAGYVERLADPMLAAELRGYLNGSIDLLARSPEPDGGMRYAVVDYKTNWLAPEGIELLVGHYRGSALREEMLRAHYALQALLYSIAAHRFLRWRVPGFDPARDFAGVLYLFLRGMAGPATPVVDGTPCGVFAWRPAPGLVQALSDLLERGSEA